MARITSSLFVSALMRRVTNNGGFAAIVHKGADQAGAIHVVMRGKNGAIALYGPAPQFAFDQNQQGRMFEHRTAVSNDQDLDAFVLRETRFDPDLWLLELETGSVEPGDLFEIMKP